MNFSKTYRRMNEPVGPSPDLIRKTLSHPDRHRLPLRRLAAAAAVAAVLLATPASGAAEVEASPRARSGTVPGNRSQRKNTSSATATRAIPVRSWTAPLWRVTPTACWRA